MPFKKIIKNQPFASAFSLGALGSLSFAPNGFFPVLFIVFPLLFLLISSTKTLRQAFVLSWLFGFGLCLLSLYWIAFALHVDWQAYKWISPIVAAGLPLLFAFYYGLGGALYKWLTRKFMATQKPSIGHIALFSALLSLVELMRGTLFTGFPWNFTAHTWADYPVMMQTLSIWGLYGLSLITIFIATLPILGRKALIASLAILFILAAFGFLRIITTKIPSTGQPVLVVQPNIPQVEKWDPIVKPSHIERLSEYTYRGHPEHSKWVIMPETAVAYAVQELSTILRWVARGLKPNDVLFTGAIRTDEKGDYYNSLFILNAHGQEQQAYDKHHLVPFGEYMPFRSWLNLLPIAAQTVDFQPGAGARTIQIGAFSVSPLICYEVIFPNRVVNRKAPRPDLLMNVTNDAWYLNSIGPYQHLAVSRFRAVEEGIPLARSANTGISALVDPLGRLVGIVPLGQEGMIYDELPAKLPRATLFSIFGHGIYLSLIVLFFALFAFYAYKNREN